MEERPRLAIFRLWHAYQISFPPLELAAVLAYVNPSEQEQ